MTLTPEDTDHLLIVTSLVGEDFVLKLTEDRHLSDTERAGQQLLNDYRAGALGSVALEIPKCRQ